MESSAKSTTFPTNTRVFSMASIGLYRTGQGCIVKLTFLLSVAKCSKSRATIRVI